jgi:hypothetical protein
MHPEGTAAWDDSDAVPNRPVKRRLPRRSDPERRHDHCRRWDADLRHFVAGGGAVVPDLPAINRVFVRFTDAGGALRGETSVAVRTR